MKMLIAGDMVIKQDYDALSNIDQNMVELFKSSDFNIVNLEAPITSSKDKILKTGPHLKANTKSTIQALKHLNINIATLANNHIKDYGQQGVLDTIDFCKNNSIIPIGAGENIEQASKALTLNTVKGRIAIINIAENEWASADRNYAGANGMDLIKDYNCIKTAKETHDFVIVIVHGGLEYYNLPSPKIQQRYRFYVDSGSDLVIGHHTHCLSGYENYKGSPIYYSLGNFLFTEQSKHESWYTGMVLEVIFEDGNICVNPYPIRQSHKFHLTMLEGKEKEKVLMDIEKYNSFINNREKLIEEWNSLINSKIPEYMNYWSPKIFIKSRYIKGVLSRLNINLSNTQGLAFYLNLMRCEIHSEISKQVIEKEIRRHKN